MNGRRADTKALFAGLGIVLVAVAASYINTLNASFHLDDFHSILNNSYIRDISNIHRNFVDTEMSSGSPEGKGGFRPLVNVSCAINYAISGNDTWSYHVFNILLHIAVTVGIFYLSLFMLRKSSGPPAAALVAAAVFGLHPVHTGAVTYIIARSALMCALFYSLAFYCYVLYREGKGLAWLGACFGSFLLALLSKETAVTLPVVILLYEMLVVRGHGTRRLVPAALLFAVGIAYTILRYIIMSVHGNTEMSGLSADILAQPGIILDYARLYALPVNLDFMPYVHAPSSLVAPGFIIPMAVISVVLAVMAYFRKEHGMHVFFAAWFFVALIPETFANLREPMMEYRLYLPSVGLTLLTASAASRLYGGSRRNAVSLVAAVVLVSCCFWALSFERNRVYADEVSLWSDTAAKNPESALASVYLGDAYLVEGRYYEAADWLSRGLKLDPMPPGAYKHYSNLGLAWQGAGKHFRAYEAFFKSLAINPRDETVLVNMGLLLMEMERPAEAAGYFRTAVEAAPGSVNAKVGLYEALEAAKAAGH